MLSTGASLFALFFAMNSLEGTLSTCRNKTDVFLSDSLVESVIESVAEIFPNVKNVAVVTNDCRKVSLESTYAVHLTPSHQSETTTLPCFAFRDSSTCIIGMGHSVESQIDVARTISKEHGWRRFELWLESDDVSLPRLSDFDVVEIRRLTSPGRRRSENEIVVAHCFTSACFNTLKTILLEWNGSNAWIFTEDLTKKFLFHNYLRRLLPSYVRTFGMMRRFPESETWHERFLSSSRTGTLLAQCTEDVEERILPNVVYLHDALLLLGHLHQRNASNLNPQTIRYHAQKLDSLSAGGPIRFDNELKGRNHDHYNIFSLSDPFAPTVAAYSRGALTTFSNEKSPVTVKKRSAGHFIKCSPADKDNSTKEYHFRVVTVEEPPFIFHNPNTRSQFRGFLVDLLEELGKTMRFTYEITLVQEYGEFNNTNESDVHANGLLDEIFNCRADLGVAPIGISASRQNHVDFTKPWMDYGLALLTSSKHPMPSSYFAFFAPFSARLWILVIVFLIVVSTAFPLLRLVAPPPAKRDDDDDDDDKNPSRDLAPIRKAFRYFRRRLYDSIWLIFATAMQQGPDGAPFLPARILVGCWYFFSLIVIATYTANLTAFLTLHRLPAGISSIEELAAQGQIPYGTVRNTAIETFFVESNIKTYKTIGKFIEATPNALVNNSMEGLRRASAQSFFSGDEYVFIWDLPVLQYLASQRPCQTQVVGRSFHKQGYGIVMPKGMPYLDRFSWEVLKLRESGWIEKSMGDWSDAGECGSGRQSPLEAERVDVTNMIGVFILLSVGVVVAFLVAIFQRVLHKRLCATKKP